MNTELQSWPAGFQSRIPAVDYFAEPAISISKLKELRRSPQHYRYRLEHPAESAAMTLGTAAHCATLEPERFSREFVTWDRRIESGRAAPRNGKAWDAFCAEAAGRTVITADEHTLAKAIAHAVRSDAVASRYLESGEPEVTMAWTMAGRPCKGRVDWLTQIDGEPVLVGLKTTRDCRHFAFGASAARLGYALQWFWYWSGYEQITGRHPRMIEIVAEAAPPHAVVVYVIPEDVLEYGKDQCAELLAILDRCEREDVWPGPAETEQVLTLPSWCYESEDDVGDLGLVA